MSTADWNTQYAPLPAPEGAAPTDEDWLSAFDALPPAQRLEAVAQLRENTRVAYECFVQDHRGRIRSYERQLLEHGAQRDG